MQVYTKIIIIYFSTHTALQRCASLATVVTFCCCRALETKLKNLQWPTSKVTHISSKKFDKCLK